jgi:hypothetical protein
MVKFKFERINQKTIPHYRSPASATSGSADGTVRPSSNAGATAYTSQTTILSPARPSTSPRADNSAPGRPLLKNGTSPAPRSPRASDLQQALKHMQPTLLHRSGTGRLPNGCAHSRFDLCLLSASIDHHNSILL